MFESITHDYDTQLHSSLGLEFVWLHALPKSVSNLKIMLNKNVKTFFVKFLEKLISLSQRTCVF